MKVCFTCKEEKDLSQFRKDKSRADGYQSSCKVCASNKIRSAYTQKYGEKARQRNKEIGNRNREAIAQYKAKIGCLICREADPCCLEFHHIDPTLKEIGIAENVSSSLERLFKEIEKCVCLCSNCHKKVHAGKISLLP